MVEQGTISVHKTVRVVKSRSRKRMCRSVYSIIGARENTCNMREKGINCFEPKKATCVWTRSIYYNINRPIVAFGRACNYFTFNSVKFKKF